MKASVPPAAKRATPRAKKADTRDILPAHVTLQLRSHRRVLAQPKGTYGLTVTAVVTAQLGFTRVRMRES